MMKNFKHILFVLIFILGLINRNEAQTIKASASPNPATVNSTIQVTFTITGPEAQSFESPDFNGFRVLGQMKSSSTSISNINGRMTSNTSKSIIYSVQPTKTGKLTIGSAKAKVNGKWISSNTLTIEVVGQGQSSAQRGNTQQYQNNSNYNKSGTNENVFLKAIIDKSNLNIGEQAVITYKLYYKTNIKEFICKKTPSMNGFWSYDLLKNSKAYNQYTEVVNGQQFSVAEIKKTSIIAQKSGKININPLEIECIIEEIVRDERQHSFFFDPFVYVQNVKKNVRSNSINVNVNELPANNKPADFNGAVGQFSIKSETDKTNVTQNDAISYKITVSGSGNLQLIEDPKIIFPSDFEAYDPKVSENIQHGVNGVSGSKTFEYLLIPRNAGTFTIPSYSFSYYDLKSKSYKTIQTPSYQINVKKGNGSNANLISGTNKEDIKYLGSDIRHIKLNNSDLNFKGKRFFNSWSFYLALLLPLVLFFLIVILLRKQIEIRNNSILMKNRKATKMARLRLRKAENYLKTQNADAYYEELSKALWGYISDKFSIPVSEISLENVKQILSQKNITETLSNNLLELLNDCEFARFAPGDKDKLMHDMYEKASDFIQNIEIQLRNQKK